MGMSLAVTTWAVRGQTVLTFRQRRAQREAESSGPHSFTGRSFPALQDHLLQEGLLHTVLLFPRGPISSAKQWRWGRCLTRWWV